MLQADFENGLGLRLVTQDALIEGVFYHRPGRPSIVRESLSAVRTTARDVSKSQDEVLSPLI